MSGRWTENGHGVGHKSPMLGTFFVRKTGWPNVPHLTFFSSRQETIENHKINPDDFSVIDEYIRPRRAQVVLTSGFEKGNNKAVDLTYPNYKN